MVTSAMMQIYDEQLIPMIAKATSDITGITIETIMESAGRHFINYIAQIRYVMCR